MIVETSRIAALFVFVEVSPVAALFVALQTFLFWPTQSLELPSQVLWIGWEVRVRFKQRLGIDPMTLNSCDAQRVVKPSPRNIVVGSGRRDWLVDFEDHLRKVYSSKALSRCSVNRFNEQPTY